MTQLKNKILQGKHSKPILVDVYYHKTNQHKPLIIFCHGYKGFKDWGAWHLMATAFAEAGFVFVKFNFSHNGGTVNQPIDFPDLNAFGQNNYTKELDDLETVIDWCCSAKTLKGEVTIDDVTLVGHSRGGGIVCIKAEEDKRVKRVVTLAGVSDFKKRLTTTDDLKQWKEKGVKYIINGRTQQKMPHFYQFYEDFIANETRLTIQRAVEQLQIPFCIIHGKADTSIDIYEAENLHAWNTNSELYRLENANHVFGAKHPWESNQIPPDLDEAIRIIKDFSLRS